MVVRPDHARGVLALVCAAGSRTQLGQLRFRGSLRDLGVVQIRDVAIDFQHEPLSATLRHESETALHLNLCAIPPHVARQRMHSGER